MPEARPATRRFRPLWAVAVGVGVLLTAGTAGAATTLILHGRGELVSQPLAGDLAVLEVRLEPALMPGAASDVVLRVRNRSAVQVVADRVRLTSPLREARPAGCTAHVSGPLTRSGGVTLIGVERVPLEPGATTRIVVPAALTLAAAAERGCGFRVTVDVQAVAIPPRTPPPTRPTTDPTMPPTSAPPTSATPTPSGTTLQPPPMPTLDCDPADPGCEP